jgi:hypothetical protein
LPELPRAAAVLSSGTPRTSSSKAGMTPQKGKSSDSGRDVGPDADVAVIQAPTLAKDHDPTSVCGRLRRGMAKDWEIINHEFRGIEYY